MRTSYITISLLLAFLIGTEPVNSQQEEGPINNRFSFYNDHFNFFFGMLVDHFLTKIYHKK